MELIFLLLSLITILLFTYATHSVMDSAILVIWACIVSFLASKSVFIDFPFFLAIALLITLLIGLFVYKRLKRKAVYKVLLLAIHVLRIPVEFILYKLYLAGSIPILMTFRGWNYDLLIGCTALILVIVSLFVRFSKMIGFIRVWSVIGILSLASVVIIAVLSSPIPIQQLAFDQPNQALLYFPYVLLPCLIVPIVFLSHFLLLRTVRHGEIERAAEATFNRLEDSV